MVASLHHGIKLFDFDDHLGVGWGEVASQFRKDINCFCASTVGDEPSRRFWQEDDSGRNYKHWNRHERKRESPSEFNSHVSDAKVDPVGDDNSEEIGDKDERESRATIVGF